MIVTDNFVFIHLPKTGGTFVTKMLEKVAKEVPGFNARDMVGLKHAGVRKIPDDVKDLPVVINIRNTFEHYVSRFSFNWWSDPKHYKASLNMDLVMADFPNFPKLSFSEYLRYANDWRYRKKMGEKIRFQLAEKKFGFNSWFLIRLTQERPGLFVSSLDDMTSEQIRSKYSKFRFLRTENLNEDLFNLLVEAGAPSDKIDFIVDQKPILPKRGGRGNKGNTWQEYFSEDDIKFVTERDKFMFDLFPYMNPNQ